MKLLGVEASLKSLSVCIIEDEDLLSEITLNTGETHSKNLLKIIDESLNKAGLSIKDIDGFAVTLGPGSFTGLRIGLSAVKGLASVTKKPVAGISSLDALAYQAGFPNMICALLDARKNEVYCSIYRRIDNKKIRISDESVSAPEQAISEINEPCMFIGSGALLYKDLIIQKVGGLSLFPPLPDNIIRASSVAYLGLEMFLKNQASPAESIVPHYIRKPDIKPKSL